MIINISNETFILFLIFSSELGFIFDIHHILLLIEEGKGTKYLIFI